MFKMSATTTPEPIKPISTTILENQNSAEPVRQRDKTLSVFVSSPQSGLTFCGEGMNVAIADAGESHKHPVHRD